MQLIMKTKKTITILFFLTGCFIVKAQDLETVMSKVINTYTAIDSYSINMNYTLYSDSISSVKKDELKAEFIKNGENYYMKMKDTEMIFTNYFMIKISHPEKIILYSKTKIAINDILKSQNPFVEFSNYFNSKKMIDKKNYWECSFSNPKNNQLPYNKIVLQISKQDFSVLKQIYFFNKSVEKQFNSNAKKGSNERLEIVQTSFNDSFIAPDNLFSLKKYLTQINDDKYKASSYIKDYQILTQ